MKIYLTPTQLRYRRKLAREYKQKCLSDAFMPDENDGEYIELEIDERKEGCKLEALAPQNLSDKEKAG